MLNYRHWAPIGYSIGDYHLTTPFLAVRFLSGDRPSIKHELFLLAFFQYQLLRRVPSIGSSRRRLRARDIAHRSVEDHSDLTKLEKAIVGRATQWQMCARFREGKLRYQDSLRSTGACGQKGWP